MNWFCPFARFSPVLKSGRTILLCECFNIVIYSADVEDSESNVLLWKLSGSYTKQSLLMKTTGLHFLLSSTITDEEGLLLSMHFVYYQLVFIFNVADTRSG